MFISIIFDAMKNKGFTVKYIYIILQEVHLLHKFQDDFYGKELKVIIVGYIRPEKDFSSIGNTLL